MFSKRTWEELAPAHLRLLPLLSCDSLAFALAAGSSPGDTGGSCLVTMARAQIDTVEANGQWGGRWIP